MTCCDRFVLFSMLRRRDSRVDGEMDSALRDKCHESSSYPSYSLHPSCLLVKGAKRASCLSREPRTRTNFAVRHACSTRRLFERRKTRTLDWQLRSSGRWSPTDVIVCRVARKSCTHVHSRLRQSERGAVSKDQGRSIHGKASSHGGEERRVCNSVPALPHGPRVQS